MINEIREFYNIASEYVRNHPIEISQITGFAFFTGVLLYKLISDFKNPNKNLENRL